MAYSLNPSSDGCYTGTTCLVNKLNIQDAKLLEDVEAQISFAKTVLLYEQPIKGNFDFDHFKKIHEFLFCNLYDWAGQVRKVDISKKRTKFLDAESVNDIAEKSFRKVANGYFENLSFAEFVRRIAIFYNDVNYIHPF